MDAEALVLVLVDIAGGESLRLPEGTEAASAVEARAHPDAEILFNVSLVSELRDELEVVVLAIGSGAATS